MEGAVTGALDNGLGGGLSLGGTEAAELELAVVVLAVLSFAMVLVAACALFTGATGVFCSSVCAAAAAG
jgi:hypothetical protein